MAAFPKSINQLETGTYTVISYNPDKTRYDTYVITVETGAASAAAAGAAAGKRMKVFTNSYLTAYIERKKPTKKFDIIISKSEIETRDGTKKIINKVEVVGYVREIQLE
jgi:C-terminal processing protease CtpA/Prc